MPKLSKRVLAYHHKQDEREKPKRPRRAKQTAFNKLMRERKKQERKS